MPEVSRKKPRLSLRRMYEARLRTVARTPQKPMRSFRAFCWVSHGGHAMTLPCTSKAIAMRYTGGIGCRMERVTVVAGREGVDFRIVPLVRARPRRMKWSKR